MFDSYFDSVFVCRSCLGNLFLCLCQEKALSRPVTILYGIVYV